MWSTDGVARQLRINCSLSHQHDGSEEQIEVSCPDPVAIGLELSSNLEACLESHFLKQQEHLERLIKHLEEKLTVDQHSGHENLLHGFASLQETLHNKFSSDKSSLQSLEQLLRGELAASTEVVSKLPGQLELLHASLSEPSASQFQQEEAEDDDSESQVAVLIQSVSRLPAQLEQLRTSVSALQPASLASVES